MASSSCCSWRSFQVMVQIHVQGPRDLGEFGELGECGSRGWGEDFMVEGGSEDSVFIFLS